MSSYDYSSSFDQRMAIDAAASERLAFIRRTYLHVAGALIALAISLAALVTFVPGETMVRIFGAGGMVGPFVILLGFIGLTYLAQRLANSDMPITTQYLGLGLMVAAYAFVLWPTVWVLTSFDKYQGILGQAVLLTLALAGGLTLSVLTMKKDFSFMGPALSIGSIVVLGVIVASWLFGFNLGLFFSFIVIALMAGFILYETSMVLHHLRTNQHVLAASMIFSSVATLFIWIARALMQSRN